jgi:uncharacterized protein YggE
MTMADEIDEGSPSQPDETYPQGSAPRQRKRRGPIDAHGFGWPMIGMAVALVVAIALGAAALANSPGAAKPRHGATLVAARTSAIAPKATITVTGSGTVEGTPDTVSFDIGVHTTALTATSALAENNAKMVALQKSLKSSGVLPKNMQTSNLNLNENQNRYGVVTGFSVDDDLNVTMTGIKNAGRAIDAAANAAGNGVELYGVTFSISNQSSLLAAARAKAVENARTEAEQVASGAGLSLGGVASVTDQENVSQPVNYGYGAAASLGAFKALPFQAGSQPVSVQVRVVYLLAS